MRGNFVVAPEVDAVVSLVVAGAEASGAVLDEGAAAESVAVPVALLVEVSGEVVAVPVEVELVVAPVEELPVVPAVSVLPVVPVAPILPVVPAMLLMGLPAASTGEFKALVPALPAEFAALFAASLAAVPALFMAPPAELAAELAASLKVVLAEFAAEFALSAAVPALLFTESNPVAPVVLAASVVSAPAFRAESATPLAAGFESVAPVSAGLCPRGTQLEKVSIAATEPSKN